MSTKKTHKVIKQSKDNPKKPNKTRRNKAENREVLATDFSKVRKANEYLEFVNFIALPRVLRHEVVGVETQEEFCQQFKVDKRTLSKWKKVAGFWDDVAEMRRALFRERSADVLLSLEAKCLNPSSVTGGDVKVYLTAIGEYQERHEIENELSPQLLDALAKIDRMLP